MDNAVSVVLSVGNELTEGRLRESFHFLYFRMTVIDQSCDQCLSPGGKTRSVEQVIA